MNIITRYRELYAELERKRLFYESAAKEIAARLIVLEEELKRDLYPEVDEKKLDSLSEKEREIFELMGQNLGSGEIAKRLGRSQKTVEAHRETLKKKLGFGSVYELKNFAVSQRNSGGLAGDGSPKRPD